MTIKFEKEIELTGETWYKIWVDDRCIKATQDQDIARKFYSDVIERGKKGIASKEVLAEETITPKP